MCYAEEHIYNLLWQCATQRLQKAMDLAYLLAQRKVDAFKVGLPDLKEGSVWVQQNKTGAKVRSSVEGELELVINGILESPGVS